MNKPVDVRGHASVAFKAIVLDGVRILMFATLVSIPLVVLMWVVSPVMLAVLLFHSLVDDPGWILLLALFYHALQFSMIGLSGLYFGVHSWDDKPTWGMKQAGLRSDGTGKPVSRYCNLAALVVIPSSLILLEAFFELAFGISIIGRIVRDGPWI